MKIGLFDSGLGGLSVAQSIISVLPEFDYVYLGDTKRVPYGGRSQETIHEFVAEALDFLFAQDCRLVILACNTASAEALRAAQQDYLPQRFPDRNVLGVLIPCVEAALEHDPKVVGVLSTASTKESGSYPREFARQRRGVECRVLSAPMLVPLVEHGAIGHAGPFLDDYIEELGSVDTLLLGCTHYGVLIDQFRKRVSVPIIRSEDVVPLKLKEYLDRHPEHASALSRGGTRRFFVTDRGPDVRAFAEAQFGATIDIERVDLCP